LSEFPTQWWRIQGRRRKISSMIFKTVIFKITFMKRTLIIAACIFFSFNSLMAQSNSEDVDMIQAAFGKEKKDLVSEYMQIPAKDSVAFWKLYDEYEGKRKALGKQRIGIIQQYADNYDKLTDAKATQLATGVFSNDAKYTQLYQAYFTKFSSVIG